MTTGKNAKLEKGYSNEIVEAIKAEANDVALAAMTLHCVVEAHSDMTEQDTLDCFEDMVAQIRYLAERLRYHANQIVLGTTAL
jgi:hypothetical protein